MEEIERRFKEEVETKKTNEAKKKDETKSHIRLRSQRRREECNKKGEVRS